jgi:hypothetical protein
VDIEDELVTAVETDHGCADLAGCDIARSLHEGFVFTAAWLLIGATETPTIGAVLARYPDVKLHPFPSDFEEWKAWHDEHKVVCPHCEHIMYDAGGPCSNCGKPMPAPCTHSWVAGMMCVHEEDLATVAAMRAASGSSLPECERCELVYDPQNPPAMSWE